MIARSGEEDTKTFLVPDDVDRVTEGRCRGFLIIGASEMEGCNMEFFTAGHVIDIDVEVKASYS